MRRATRFLGGLLLACAALPSAASARDLPVQGGAGGTPFRTVCPAGSYLTGLLLRAGSLIESVQPLCASQAPESRDGAAGHSFGRASPAGVPHGGKGGVPTGQTCPADRFVAGIRIGFTRAENRPEYLDYVELRCRQVDAVDPAQDTAVCTHTGNGCWTRHPSPGPFDGSTLAFQSQCGPEEAVTGLAGRSGLFVDALGLVCDRRPRLTRSPARPDRR